jgi:hypothetical protein
MSLDKQRIAHLSSCCEKMKLHYLALFEDIGCETSEYNIEFYSKSFRIMMSIYLENRSSTSTNLQQLRFYYMKLYSGWKNKLEMAEMVSKKFSSPCRSPIWAYIYQNLVTIHNNIDHDLIIEEPIENEDFDYDEKDPKSIDYIGDFETDALTSIDTPFGFMISNSKTFLRASYMCMLYNKDRQNEGHDSRRIFSKLLKWNRYGIKNRPITFPAYSKASLYGPFQANQDAIRLGVNLVKDRIVQTYRGAYPDWDCFVREGIVQGLLKQKVESLFSTKSSSTVSEIKIKSSKDLENYDVRSKVFLELNKVLDRMSSNKFHLNLHEIFEICDGNSNVSMFKKNQIGGTREIYILNFGFRMAVKVLEDISRRICEKHPDEILTDHLAKNSFSSRHWRIVRKNYTLKKMTLKYSGDMTNWANLLDMPFFRVMLEELLPLEFHPTINKVLDLIKNKKLFYPKKLVEAFLKNPRTVLDDENLNFMKRLFLGLEESDSEGGKGLPYVKCEYGMMQGILHYTSSLYHLCHLECVRSALNTEAVRSGLNSVCSFEVSSDDEGILWTVMGTELELKEFSPKMKKIFRLVKGSMDKMFGIQTSLEKTTIGKQIFEFNSKFSFGRNTLTVPVIKFISPCLDDHPAESLHNRISNFYTSLSELRSQGASGQLCHWASILQSTSIKKNLGFMTMPWFETVNVDLSLSVFGGYHCFSPLISGLVNADFANYYVSRGRSDRLRMLKSVGYTTQFFDTKSENLSLHFRMWPTRKFKKAVKGIPSPTEIDPLVLLKGSSLTLEDSKDLVHLFSLMPGVAKSFSWLTRTHVMTTTPYLLWQCVFDGLNIMTLQEQIREKKEEEKMHISIKEIFPQHRRYNDIISTSESKWSAIPLMHPIAASIRSISPVEKYTEHQRCWQEVLEYIWFNHRRVNGHSVERLMDFFLDIKQDIPWIKETISDTLECSDFETNLEMLTFLMSYGRSTKPRSFLCRGLPKGGGKTLEDLIPLNTIPGKMVLIDSKEDDKRIGDTLMASKISGRLNTWLLLLEYSDHEDEKYLLQRMQEDLLQMSSCLNMQELKRSLLESSKYSNEVLLNFVSSLAGYTMDRYLEKNKNLRVFWIKEQKRDPQTRQWIGHGDLILTHRDKWIRCEVYNEMVVKMKYSGDVAYWSNHLSKKGFFLSNNCEKSLNQNLPRGKCWLGYDRENSCFRLNFGKIKGPRFYPRSFPGKTSFTLANKKFLPQHYKWLNNQNIVLDDLSKMAESKDPISLSIINLIKEVRKHKVAIQIKQKSAPPVFNLGEAKLLPSIMAMFQMTSHLTPEWKSVEESYFSIEDIEIETPDENVNFELYLINNSTLTSVNSLNIVRLFPTIMKREPGIRVYFQQGELEPDDTIPESEIYGQSSSFDWSKF